MSDAADEVKFWQNYYGALVGRRIIKAGLNDDGFPFFDLDDGTRVEVSRDEEGNGPGFLAGLPTTGQRTKPEWCQAVVHHPVKNGRVEGPSLCVRKAKVGQYCAQHARLYGEGDHERVVVMQKEES